MESCKMDKDTSEEEPLHSLKLMQKKKDDDDAEHELRMQQQSEATLQSVEEHKEHLQKTMQRMKDCKEDFSEYLKIKDADQQAALRRVKHDKEFVATRQEALRDLDEEISELTEERDWLERRVHKYAFYSQYMDKFVKATNMDSRRILSRFETLVLAKENLRKLSQRDHELIQEARANLDVVTQESNDFLLNLKSAVQQYERQRDLAQQNVVHWERTWNRIQKTAADETMLFGKIRMACFNLYRTVCERSRFCRECPVDSEDTYGQLETIETFIDQWLPRCK